jgi:AcrR family transcriptional regulator
MSYRRLDNIDEKIIDATILIGSTNGANKLSTKEIAKACGISEFVIYDHFQTKENLVSIADQKITSEFNEGIHVLLNEKNVALDEMWNRLVDFFIAHPDYTSFLINYSHIFPRTTKPADYDQFLANEILEPAKATAQYMKAVLPSEIDYVYVWMWIVRSAVTYAQFIVGKSLVDTPEVRAISCHCAVDGVGSFVKK